jgi:hypothetical protein
MDGPDPTGSITTVLSRLNGGDQDGSWRAFYGHLDTSEMTMRAGHTLHQEPSAIGRNGNVNTKSLPAVRAVMLAQAIPGTR